MTATATRERAPEPFESGEREDQKSEERRGLLRVAIAVLLIVGLSMALDIGGAVIVVAAILVMIMLHELGHFVTARWAGMRVTDFFVGFGPVLWSIKRGDTRYGVRGFPLGGYVRVIGMNNLEEVAPEDEDNTYRSKSYWQRVRFAGAGSFMHFVIAFVLMVVLLAGFGRVDRVAPTSTTLEAVAPSFTAGGPPTPARQAGLRAGDKLISIDDTAVNTWDDAADIISANPGRSLSMTIEREGLRFATSVTPQDARTAAEKASGVKPAGRIGIQSKPDLTVQHYSVPQALWSAGFEVKTLTVESTEALVGLFKSDSIKRYGEQLTKTGPADPSTEGNRLLSPVGVFRIADSQAEAGVAAVLFLLIAINIFVGIFNLVPLPPFDGGHIAVATYEAIRSRISGKRHMIDMAKLLPVAYMVIIALFFLSLSALWLDIVHPFDLG